MKESVHTYIEKYEEKMNELDQQLDALSEEAKTEYQEARNHFSERLRVWKDQSKTEYESFKNNVDEGYHALEAKLHRIRKK